MRILMLILLCVVFIGCVQINPRRTKEEPQDDTPVEAPAEIPESPSNQ